ncbi:MAG: hypothetical protein Q7R34_03350 [Dehalococcoidia bacterium]|nr:hypothetical protein [Dehalococcoidia bacterium]
MSAILFNNRTERRERLKNNHDKEKEVWIAYYKKDSGKLSLRYEEAVEEALCYGWIDSLVKKLDEEKYMQKFTPRKPDSTWST